jgi:serine/threonine protein kinase/tetratricopeptide (TPR) repeat protein
MLEARCGSDPELLAAVLAMLEADRSTSLLDRDVAHAAEQVLRDARSLPLPLDRFGPYRIEDVLGEGGMGVVYLARRGDLGSVAAIKILRDAWLSPARRERFAAEQRTLAQLNHPSIARLYDADTLPNGTPWFAMEYVEGVPLTSYCTTHRLGIPERLGLFREVCEAVQHAHQHLVVHRDLKPSNILVTPGGAIKLLDFGIAKQLESLELADDLTRTGLRLMTPAYAAPEQLRGGRVGVQTDVYALGVVLYELLAGRLPFDLSNRTPGEAEAAILEQDPERPAAAARDSATARTASKTMWVDLDVLCLTAMHKDPLHRYQTVEALIRDVDHYLAAQPLDARPDTLGYRMGKFVRRNRAPVTASAGALALLIGLVLFYTVRLTGARNTARAEASRAERIQRFTMNLFEGGDKEAGPAESLRVVTLVDRGLQEAQTLVAEPAVQADVYSTLGSIYEKLGQLDRADTLLSTALEKRRVLFATGSPEMTRGLVALGQLRVDQARFEDAERLIRQGLEESRRRLPANHPAVAEAAFALGKVLEERGQYDRSIQASEESARLYAARGDAARPEFAASLAQVADAHFYSGHYETADSLNRVVLDIYRELYGERHPLVAAVLINLGASQQERGHYDVAERFDRQGLEIIRAFYGDDHHETAYALTQVARALVFEDRYDEAVALLQKALVTRERVYGPNHPSVASTVNELGNVALTLGRLDDAEAYFKRMVEIYREVYGGKHQYVGVAQSNLASVYVKREQYARAEQLYREVIKLYQEVLPPDHINMGIARIKLGRSLLRQHRYAEAATESLTGYEIVSKQASPAVSFLKAARGDLVIAYDSLHQPERAARFKAELADTAAGTKP